MADPIRVMVNGALGRMGGAVIQLVAQETGIELVGAIEHPKHKGVGGDVGETHGLGHLGVVVSANLVEGDVLVDFSSPESTVRRAAECAEQGIALVIGTTGLADPEMEAIRKAAESVPCLQSANMSLGISLATRIISDLARVLSDEFDVEIVETHHRHKKDAPSGTALRLARAISRARGESEPSIATGRRGLGGERVKGEIGIHSLRMGEETGQHRVIFNGPGERIEIGHVAHSREAFARGALRAVRFVHQRRPGLYDISDVFTS